MVNELFEAENLLYTAQLGVEFGEAKEKILKMYHEVQTLRMELAGHDMTVEKNEFQHIGGSIK